jgi:hypothetical protein
MEGVFIAGNGFRAIGVIAALEEDLGRPVLTGNQVAFWCALRLAGVGAEVDNCGQVFKKKPNRREKRRKAGQVRYWQYGQAEKSPDLAISDLSRFLSSRRSSG